MLAPLCDIAGDRVHPTEKVSFHALYSKLKFQPATAAAPAASDEESSYPPLYRVTPFDLSSKEDRDGLLSFGFRTYVMGILNTTPDSFSDGGKYNTLEAAVEQAHV